MALFDKVKEQANQLAQKAQEAGKAGQAKIEDAQARRKSDAMLRQMGALVYAQRTGSTTDNDAEIDRLVGQLKAFEAEHGPITGDDAADPPSAPGAADTPEGGFKL